MYLKVLTLYITEYKEQEPKTSFFIVDTFQFKCLANALLTSYRFIGKNDFRIDYAGSYTIVCIQCKNQFKIMSSTSAHYTDNFKQNQQLHKTKH